ncbi:MAG: hypothetical protein GY867_03300 [bacterium]|nr:hypothetical protein [bacterium]
MSRRKIGILGLATYLVVYICLLVPGHLAAFAADHAADQGINSSQADCDHHDSGTCQICIAGGHHAALWTSFSLCVELHAVFPVEPRKPTRADSLHVDHISARAPPMFA